MEPVNTRAPEPHIAQPPRSRLSRAAAEWVAYGLLLASGVALVAREERGNLAQREWAGRNDLVAMLLLAAAVAVAVALRICQRRRRVAEDAAVRLAADREARNEHIRVAEQELRLAVEGAGIGIWSWDPQDNRVQTSGHFRAIVGQPGDDVLTAERLLRQVHPDDREQVLAALGQCLKDTSPVRLECRVAWPDGSIRWLAVIGAAFRNADDASPRLHGIVRDITALKALHQLGEENRAHLAEQVERQVAVQTASAFAHDVNQPLLAISAYSEAALNLLKRSDPDLAKLAKMIEGSYQQAQRAGSLIHELSAHLSQAASALPNPDTFDLNQLVRECIAAHASRRGGAQAPDLQLDATLPSVSGSRSRTQRVLASLLDNAYASNSADGTGAACPSVAVCTFRGDATAVVAVSDTGAGVPVGDTERIFSPFFSTSSSGLGLGLSISRALAESQGGHLTLVASGGQGSTFHFTVPLANSHANHLSG